MHQQQLEKGLRLFSACCRLEAKLAQYELLYDTNPILEVAVSAEHSDTNPILQYDTNPTTVREGFETLLNMLSVLAPIGFVS